MKSNKLLKTLIFIIPLSSCATSALMDHYSNISSNQSYVNGKQFSYTKVDTNEANGMVCSGSPAHSELNRAYEQLKSTRQKKGCFLFQCELTVKKKEKVRLGVGMQFDIFKDRKTKDYSDCKYIGDLKFKSEMNVVDGVFPFTPAEKKLLAAIKLEEWKKTENDCLKKGNIDSCDRAYIYYAKTDKNKSLKYRNEICSHIGLPQKYCGVLKKLRPR